ncbi:MULTISPECIES: hypothetical protein [Clostridium]|uniref:hypothetical protein n=1 Tax=Clostridium TaxID=1485 RepID=UPI00082405AD|nr:MULTISPECIES: hypothetical protein [Clostridium]PJI09169.1 hypothetical protein CUB90_15385 [Clostridium sp. CT7]
MIRKERFGTIMNLGMNAILGVVLTSVALTLLNALIPLVFIQNFILSLAIGFFVGDLIPAPALGEKLADALGCKGKFMRHLISTIVISLLMVTIISFLCQFISFGTKMMPIWLKCMPYLLGFGTAAIFIALPIVLRIALFLTAGYEEHTDN